MKAFRVAVLGVAAVLATTAAQAQTREGRGKPANEAAAQQNSLVPQPRQEKQFPLGISFVAVSLNGKPIGGPGERPAFSLDQTFRARGFGGCNNYSATAYPLREQGIVVGPFAVTKRACAAGTLAAERAFLTALRSAAKWELIGNDTLVIKGGAGELRLQRAL